jgi:hypothetical protein
MYIYKNTHMYIRLFIFYVCICVYLGSVEDDDPEAAMDYHDMDSMIEEVYIYIYIYI